MQRGLHPWPRFPQAHAVLGGPKTKDNPRACEKHVLYWGRSLSTWKANSFLPAPDSALCSGKVKRSCQSLEKSPRGGTCLLWGRTTRTGGGGVTGVSTNPLDSGHQLTVPAKTSLNLQTDQLCPEAWWVETTAGWDPGGMPETQPSIQGGHSCPSPRAVI